VNYYSWPGLEHTACLSKGIEQAFNKNGENDNGYHVGYSFVVVENRSVTYGPYGQKICGENLGPH